ncbi:MAG: ABC transporter permease [Mycobacteriales bacterium]
MRRLLGVELLRFRSRRAMKVMCIGSLLLVVFIMFVQFLTHTKSDGSEVERFRANRAASYEQARTQLTDQLAQLENDPNFPPAELERMRSRVDSVTREQYLAGQDFSCDDCRQSPGTDDYNAASDMKEGVKAIGFIFAFAAFLVGATAAGAEWNHGTMQSLLFWESRRVRVILAKVAAVVISMVAVAALAQLVGHALSVLVGKLRGTTAGMTSGWWQSQVITTGRGLGLVAFAAALGFALAFATRNTGFAFGVAFVYFAIIQQLLVGWKPWLIRYVLIGPMAAWMNNGFREEIGGRNGPNGEWIPNIVSMSARYGGFALLIYAVVAVALAAAWFRARDVT